MWRTVSRASAMMLAVSLGGCGLFQSVADSTRETTHAVFYKQVKTLHLDFSGRSALNTDFQEMNLLSVPALVRVYQLRDRKALDKASYEELLDGSQQMLGADLLDQRALVVTPEQGAQLSMPLHREAKHVAVVALFRFPEPQAGTWRLVLQRDDLDPDRARLVELGDNHLSLRPQEG
ncbi:type VI secretion system lipoprotein TssJ [Pseudomonas sp. 148P]|uniref:Type VI secretion system lipoprotein TssJ n=1 Tax=Pseudomonas ulcerans TaxID=3115852 RepID=A0ABU7HZY5_9PSED|nr:MULTISPECIES: type VI secretion system lipoprotein TssJ [unclassified Pseudomonas]MEE1925808.1 type VI secretion system lipoprotein TssJ [Pseudomonas sp. 147P]MEE1937140.1 type VI secretion system lipoprotein TssJ [Pseudomonas sp. 148P]